MDTHLQACSLTQTQEEDTCACTYMCLHVHALAHTNTCAHRDAGLEAYKERMQPATTPAAARAPGCVEALEAAHAAAVEVGIKTYREKVRACVRVVVAWCRLACMPRLSQVCPQTGTRLLAIAARQKVSVWVLCVREHACACCTGGVWAPYAHAMTSSRRSGRACAQRACPLANIPPYGYGPFRHAHIHIPCMVFAGMRVHVCMHVCVCACVW